MTISPSDSIWLSIYGEFLVADPYPSLLNSWSRDGHGFYTVRKFRVILYDTQDKRRYPVFAGIRLLRIHRLQDIFRQGRQSLVISCQIFQFSYVAGPVIVQQATICSLSIFLRSSPENAAAKR